MTEEVKRNYLEINSLQDLIEGNKPSEDYSLSLINPINFQLNKFFYKNIGKKHKWVDRLTWSEEKWINYVSSKNVNSYVLKQSNIVNNVHAELIVTPLLLSPTIFTSKLTGKCIGVVTSYVPFFNSIIPRSAVIACTAEDISL